MKEDSVSNTVQTDISRAQLILAEKRTSLAVIRTGIAVMVLPLSVVTALIALSRYYDVVHNLPLLIPLLLVCLGLILFGGVLLGRSLLKIRHQDLLLRNLKNRDPHMQELLD